MAARAIAKYVKVPPRKARLVADLVRGKDANQASSILRFTPQKGGRLIGRVLKSALANAAAGGEVDVDTLFVQKITIDPGPALKRYMSRAHGRATKILRRTSHITVELGER